MRKFFHVSGVTGTSIDKMLNPNGENRTTVVKTNKKEAPQERIHWMWEDGIYTAEYQVQKAIGYSRIAIVICTLVIFAAIIVSFDTLFVGMLVFCMGILLRLITTYVRYRPAKKLLQEAEQLEHHGFVGYRYNGLVEYLFWEYRNNYLPLKDYLIPLVSVAMVIINLLTSQLFPNLLLFTESLLVAFMVILCMESLCLCFGYKYNYIPDLDEVLEDLNHTVYKRTT